MKEIIFEAIIVGLILATAFALTACATREAKEDCLASFSVAEIMTGESIDWTKVQHWNCKK
jgi:hypothetical protein